MFWHDKTKGSVLLMTLMFMIALTIMATLFLNMVMVNSTNASAVANSAQALYLAEAGINKAIYYLQATSLSGYTAPDGSTNGTWRTTAYPAVAGNYAPAGTLPASCTLTSTQPCQESLDGGFSSYTMWVVTAGNKIQITSSGAYNGLIRTEQVLVTQPSGLVGWWKFDEAASGTCSGAVLIDSSGNSNTGTCNSGSTWATGQIGTGAMSFNSASSQYVSTSTNVGSPPAGFSLSAWFNTSTASGTKIVGIENTQTGTGSSAWDRHIYMGTDGKIYFGVWDSSAHLVTSSSTLNNGSWHHAVGTNSGTISTLYIDGASQGTTAGGAYNSYGTAYWHIGGYKSSGWTNGVDGYFNGMIDDVRIYNRALSASEVAALYSQGLNGQPMIEGSGPSIVYGSRKEI